MIRKGSFFLATVAVLGFVRNAHAESCKDYMSASADYTLSSSGEEGMAWDGYKTKGGYYKTVSRVSSVDECFTKCAERSRCSSFTYSESRRTCALSTKEGATSSSEVSSSTVEFCRSSGKIAGFVVSSQAQPSGTGYTADEVAKHNSRDSAWVVYDGKVYDLTDFVNLHPGGRSEILDAAGKDATSAFDRENSHREAELLTMKTYYIGDLVGGGVESQLSDAAVDDDGDDTDDDDDDDDRYDDDTDDDDDDRYDDDTDDDDDDDDRYDDDTDDDTDDD